MKRRKKRFNWGFLYENLRKIEREEAFRLLKWAVDLLPPPWDSGWNGIGRKPYDARALIMLQQVNTRTMRCCLWFTKKLCLESFFCSRLETETCTFNFYFKLVRRLLLQSRQHTRRHGRLQRQALTPFHQSFFMFTRLNTYAKRLSIQHLVFLEG